MAFLVDGASGNWRPYAAPPPPPPPPPPPKPKPKTEFQPSGATPAGPAAAQPQKAPADRPLAGFIGPLAPDQEVQRSGIESRPLAGFVGPLAPKQEVLRSGPPAVLPQKTTDGARTQSAPPAGLSADDPRATLISQGQLWNEIDQQARALGNQPIDIAAAQAKVQATRTDLDQFWSGVYKGLPPQEASGLSKLAQAIEAAPESQRAAAQAKFDAALMPKLTLKQRTKLDALERRSEDAQLHLQGQVIGKRLQMAGQDPATCSGNPAERAEAQTRLDSLLADARVHVTDVRQITAQRELQDANRLVRTPEVQRKIAPEQQQLLAAAEQARLNPESKQAQQQLVNAKLAYDRVLAGSINDADMRALDGLTATAAREQQMGQLVGTEAETLHRYNRMQLAAQRAPLNSTEQRIMGLARADLDLMHAKRDLRDTGVAAARTSHTEHKQELLGKMSGSMLEVMSQEWDVKSNRAQFNQEVAVRYEQGGQPVITPPNTVVMPPAGTQTAPLQQPQIQTVAFTAPGITAPKTANMASPMVPTLPAFTPVKAQPLTVAPEFAAALPSPQLTSAEATRQLEALKADREGFEAAMRPPPAEETKQPPKSGWDRALDVLGGVAEIAAGAAIVAFVVGTGGTGLLIAGAVVGGFAMARGVMNTTHSALDWKNGTNTDQPMSKAMQNLFGIDSNTANRIDVGIGLAVTAPVGAAGSAAMMLKVASASRAVRLSNQAVGGFGLASTVDTSIAQTRYAAFNDAATPFSVQALTAAGMSPTQANYVLMGGNLVAAGGAVVVATRAGGPAPVAAANAPNAPAAGAPAPIAAPNTANVAAAAAPEGGNPATVAASSAEKGGNAGPAAPAPETVSSLASTPNVNLLTVEGPIPQQNVAIIGSGHTGATLLVEQLANTNDGLTNIHPTLVFRRKGPDDIMPKLGPMRFNENLTKTSHEVNLGRENFAYLYEATGRRAINEADIIVVTVPDIPLARLRLFDELEGLVRPGQTIALTGTGAQPALARLVDGNPQYQGVSFALFENSPYGTRRDWDNHVIEGKRKFATEASFWGDEQAARQSLIDLFPRADQLQRFLEERGHVLETPKASWPDFKIVPPIETTMQLGYAGHTMVALDDGNLALGLQGMRYSHWNGGAMKTDPRLATRLMALDQERMALSQAYGMPGRDIYDRLNSGYQLGVQRGVHSPHEVFQKTVGTYKSLGPTLKELADGDRYITENFPNLTRTLWMADKAGLEMPLTRALLPELEGKIIALGQRFEIPNLIEKYGLYGYDHTLADFTGGVDEVTRLINSPRLH